MKTRRDWEQVRPRLERAEDRADWDAARDAYRQARAEGKFITYNGRYGYEDLQGYVRSDMLLTAMAEEPGWVRAGRRIVPGGPPITCT